LPHSPKFSTPTPSTFKITSAERVKLSQKVRIAITKKEHSLFDKIYLTSTDLKQMVGFQTNFVAAERHLAKYDLRQIFMIVDADRDSDGNILPTLKAASFSGMPSSKSRM
jgi:hypothetical protein